MSHQLKAAFPLVVFSVNMIKDFARAAVRIYMRLHATRHRDIKITVYKGSGDETWNHRRFLLHFTGLNAVFSTFLIPPFLISMFYLLLYHQLPPDILSHVIIIPPRYPDSYPEFQV